MPWQSIQLVVATAVVAYLVVTQKAARMFVGSILVAIGLVGLVVALVAWAPESEVLGAYGLGLLAAGVILLWFTDLFRRVDGSAVDAEHG